MSARTSAILRATFFLTLATTHGRCNLIHVAVSEDVCPVGIIHGLDSDGPQIGKALNIFPRTPGACCEKCSSTVGCIAFTFTNYNVGTWSNCILRSAVGHPYNSKYNTPVFGVMPVRTTTTPSLTKTATPTLTPTPTPLPVTSTSTTTTSTSKLLPPSGFFCNSSHCTMTPFRAALLVLAVLACCLLGAVLVTGKTYRQRIRPTASTTSSSGIGSGVSFPAVSPNGLSAEHRVTDVHKHEINESDIQFGSVLGKGGYATVYVTYWQGSKTAAKCFDMTGLAAKACLSLKRSFDTEIEVAFELRSPRVLSVFGICTSVPGHLYIIMELAEGGSVRAKIEAAEAPFEPEELWGLAHDTAMGMKYLHDHDIVHRDLKSHNVLLDAQGGAKVCDFGIAKAAGRLQEYTSGSSQNGNLVGTVAWMAPEALDGEASFPSDVFSYGVFLWELATREFPWEDELVGPILFKICLKQERLSTDAIAADGHYKALPEILARCWAHEPGNRATFDELESETSSQYGNPGLEGMLDMRPPSVLPTPADTPGSMVSTRSPGSAVRTPLQFPDVIKPFSSSTNS